MPSKKPAMSPTPKPPRAPRPPGQKMGRDVPDKRPTAKQSKDRQTR
jgi:hypothetical protein